MELSRMRSSQEDTISALSDPSEDYKLILDGMDAVCQAYEHETEELLAEARSFSSTDRAGATA